MLPNSGFTLIGASSIRRIKLFFLFVLVGVTPIVVPAVSSNSAPELVAGNVYQVPMNLATNRGSIDLPTPNGNEEYELILYSLNPYHAHIRSR